MKISFKTRKNFFLLYFELKFENANWMKINLEELSINIKTLVDVNYKEIFAIFLSFKRFSNFRTLNS